MEKYLRSEERGSRKCIYICGNYLNYKFYPLFFSFVSANVLFFLNEYTFKVKIKENNCFYVLAKAKTFCLFLVFFRYIFTSVFYILKVYS